MPSPDLCCDISSGRLLGTYTMGTEVTGEHLAVIPNGVDFSPLREAKISE